MSSLACEPEHLSMDGPMPGVPESVATNLESDSASALKVLIAKLEAVAFRLASCRSESEFTALRDEVFEKYARLSFAASSLLKAELGREYIISITKESFDAYESLFSNVPSKAPGGADEEILFSVSTLRRAYMLLGRLYETQTPAPPESKSKDRELSALFRHWALWSQLHLDCLRTSIEHNIPLGPEVVPVILDGLRGSVMAYSCVKQGIRLREPERHVELPRANWDAEDAALAEASTRERESSLSGW